MEYQYSDKSLSASASDFSRSSTSESETSNDNPVRDRDKKWVWPHYGCSWLARSSQPLLRNEETRSVGGVCETRLDNYGSNNI